MYAQSRDCCFHHQPCPPIICAVYVPVQLVAAAPDCPPSLKVPRDLEADPSTKSKQALVGGAGDVSLSLEYLVETGASSPTVTLTTTTGGASAKWTDAAPAVGYFVHEALLSAKPGTKVTLEVNNVIARVRWCETVCC